MNKEQLRKELEDCWDAASERMYKEHFGTIPEDKATYITTRLAALDDGQEGKGLPNFLVVKDSDDHYFIWPKNRYEKYVSEAVEVGATPAVKIVVGFNGDEDFLFPKPLPLADGEGEKVGVREILELIVTGVETNIWFPKFTKESDLYQKAKEVLSLPSAVKEALERISKYEVDDGKLSRDMLYEVIDIATKALSEGQPAQGKE